MGEQLTLVVAEDDDTDAMLIARNLARGGLKCKMHRVQTESDFVDALHEVKPDVIISDFSMPQFDGRRALEIAVVRAPETPFLFVSGTIGEQRAVDALRCGATDYILKSNMTRLPAAVQRAVREASVKAAQRSSQQQLRSNEEQLRATIETAQDWIWETDVYGKFRFSSPSVATILGYDAAELIGEDFRLYLSDDERDQADALLPIPGLSQLTGAVARWRTADGQLRWLERNVVAVYDDGHQLVGYRGTDRDITARREQEARLRRLTRSYRMLSSTGSAILRLRNRGELLHEICRIAVNQGGYDRVVISLIDANAKELRPQAWAGNDAGPLPLIDRAELDSDAESASMAEQTIHSGLPSICNDLHLHQSPVPHRQMLLEHGYQALATFPVLVDGTVIGVITLFSDHRGMFDDSEIEVLQELSANLGFALQFLEKDEAVHFLSYFDSLTGLAKRPLFCQRLAQMLTANSTEARSMQVVVFDIQKLGAINDSFGRYVGDRLIENMAVRLKHAYSDPEKLAYFGGGTFAMALPSIGPGNDIGPLLQYSIGRLFVEPINVEGHDFRPGLRYGIAVYPDDASAADSLVQCAEASLAAAREDSERFLPYSSITRRPSTRAFELESRLAGALERDEFLLHYQPKIDLTTGLIEGFEALLRWQDVQEGLVSPSVFIPLLERSGAIVDVGAWVLLQASHDIHLWREAGYPDIRVAVNVSPLQLRRRDFAAQVLSCIGSSRGHAGIDVEITESMLMQDIELSTRKLAELREAGVGVAIDDFGTGYSSLRLLSGLPVTTLKIDRSFVQNACVSQGGLTLVSTIISLARSFGMKTVAEGVETAEQLRMLRGLGCDQAQGYYFAKPAPSADVPTIITRLTDVPILT
jgi:PAS domain S-box-containing protein/diguanylate cyclase (GGDEF)-like protein